MERKERKSPSADTLYEVVSLESETEREKRKTTASPGIPPGAPGSMVPSPPEDDEAEGNLKKKKFRLFIIILAPPIKISMHLIIRKCGCRIVKFQLESANSALVNYPLSKSPQTSTYISLNSLYTLIFIIARPRH